MLPPFSTLLLCLTALLAPTHAARKPSNAILLSSVKSLTFRSNVQTTHRRVSSVPQLKCIGGSARGLYEPDTMRCTSSGSSYSSADVEWTCIASLPPEFKLGSTDVICEGYDSAEDEYVLKGSCGLEYRLILTSKGEEVYGKPSGWNMDAAGDTWAPRIFWIIFLGVVGWMIYSAFFRNRRGQPAAGGRAAGRGWGGWGGGGGGGGGGGDDGHNDPPPPYTPQKPYPSSSTQSQPGGAWRPGFWTGAATGAAASYLAGRGGVAPRQQQSGWGGWGGGGSGYGGRHDPGEGSSGARRSGGGGGPSYSSSRYQSSGFGSTSRR